MKIIGLPDGQAGCRHGSVMSLGGWPADSCIRSGAHSSLCLRLELGGGAEHFAETGEHFLCLLEEVEIDV